MINFLADYYSKHHGSGHRLNQSFIELQRADCFRSWMGQGRKVLDLGCRDGCLTRHFVEGNHVTGVDIDASALQYAATHYNMTTKQVDLNAMLPFDDGSFDVVVMAEVMEHLPYPRLVLGEIERLLRPDGVLIGNVPLAYHLIDRWKVVRGKKLSIAGDETHLQFFKYSEVLELLKRFFHIEQVEIFKGGNLAHKWPELFARNIGFYCKKSIHAKKT